MAVDHLHQRFSPQPSRSSCPSAFCSGSTLTPDPIKGLSWLKPIYVSRVCTESLPQGETPVISLKRGVWAGRPQALLSEWMSVEEMPRCTEHLFWENGLWYNELTLLPCCGLHSLPVLGNLFWKCNTLHVSYYWHLKVMLFYNITASLHCTW